MKVFILESADPLPEIITHFRELICAIMDRAIKDLTATEYQIVKDAINWFDSEEISAFSYVYCVQHANFTARHLKLIDGEVDKARNWAEHLRAERQRQATKDKRYRPKETDQCESQGEPGRAASERLPNRTWSNGSAEGSAVPRRMRYGRYRRIDR